MNLDIETVTTPDPATLSLEDKWILSRYEGCIREVTAALEKYELGIALSNLYDFVWDVLCDWYIELSKSSLADKGTESNRRTQNTLAFVLGGTLRLLHPFLPFVTEEIFAQLPRLDTDAESIMITPYPEYDETLVFESESARMDAVIEAIRAIRTRRAEMNVPPSRRAKLMLDTKTPEIFDGTEPFFRRLASASEVELTDGTPDGSVVRIITGSATVYIPLGELVDLEAERARLTKELEKNAAEIKRLEGKLSNEGFIAKAPAAVIDGEKAKLARAHEIRASLEAAIAEL